jgi:ABC-2 type transport system permease protein
MMITALVLRFGLGAESLAWVAIFALAPVSGIYYPIATLPDWLQPLAWALPTSHVFEGMRAVLLEGTVPLASLGAAAGLNVFYLVLGGLAFGASFRRARERGLLLQAGE